MEKHPWGFVILLVAAVLQAAKIIGFRGVFWTKVWAVIYLLSYVVISVVGSLAPKDWKDSPPEIVSRRRPYWNFETWSQALPLGAHFVCCSYILDRIVVRDSAIHQIPFLYIFVPIIVQGVTLALITVWLAGLVSSTPFLLLSWLVGVVDQFYGGISWNFGPPVSFVLISLIILGGIGGLCSFAYLSQTIFGLLLDIGDLFGASVYCAFARGSINLLLYIGLFWLTKGFLALLAVWIPLLRRFNRRIDSHGYLVVFACWNFVQAFLYYRLRYDSRDTIKPPWTDNLG